METKISNFKIPEEEKRRLQEISNELGINMTKTLVLIIDKIYENEIDRSILKGMYQKWDTIERLVKSGMSREEAQLRIMSNALSKKKPKSIKNFGGIEEFQDQDYINNKQIPLEEKERYNAAAKKYNEQHQDKKLPLYQLRS